MHPYQQILPPPERDCLLPAVGNRGGHKGIAWSANPDAPIANETGEDYVVDDGTSPAFIQLESIERVPAQRRGAAPGIIDRKQANGCDDRGIHHTDKRRRPSLVDGHHPAIGANNIVYVIVKRLHQPSKPVACRHDVGASQDDDRIGFFQGSQCREQVMDLLAGASGGARDDNVNRRALRPRAYGCISWVELALDREDHSKQLITLRTETAPQRFEVRRNSSNRDDDSRRKRVDNLRRRRIELAAEGAKAGNGSDAKPAQHHSKQEDFNNLIHSAPARQANFLGALELAACVTFRLPEPKSRWLWA